MHALSVTRYRVSRYFLRLHFPSQMAQSGERTNGNEEAKFMAVSTIATEKRFKLWIKIGF